MAVYFSTVKTFQSIIRHFYNGKHIKLLFVRLPHLNHSSCFYVSVLKSRPFALPNDDFIHKISFFPPLYQSGIKESWRQKNDCFFEKESMGTMRHERDGNSFPFLLLQRHRKKNYSAILSF